VKGRVAEALVAFRALYNFGADPAVVMLDLLEHAHGAAVAKAIGPDALTLPRTRPRAWPPSALPVGRGAVAPVADVAEGL